jgi:dihydroneopterin aldolase
MIAVQLKDVRFFAYHGVYIEELKTGNEFGIDLIVYHKPRGKKIKSIRQTINYVSLYELVKEEMQNPRQLLETLAIEITDKIKTTFLRVREVQITITKIHPPLVNFTGSVSVTYGKRF